MYRSFPKRARKERPFQKDGAVPWISRKPEHCTSHNELRCQEVITKKWLFLSIWEATGKMSTSPFQLPILIPHYTSRGGCPGTVRERVTQKTRTCRDGSGEPVGREKTQRSRKTLKIWIPEAPSATAQFNLLGPFHRWREGGSKSRNELQSSYLSDIKSCKRRRRHSSLNWF